MLRREFMISAPDQTLPTGCLFSSLNADLYCNCELLDSETKEVLFLFVYLSRSPWLVQGLYLICTMMCIKRVAHLRCDKCC